MSLPEQEQIVVIIVNWNRPQETIACIQSLRVCNYGNMKILVVDNGSSDNSASTIKEGCPEAEILILAENKGFAGGYNAGIQHAMQSKATHFFILNNDTIVDANALIHLYDSPWDVAVPKIMFYSEPEIIWAAGCRWRRFPPGVIMNGYRHKDNPAFNKPTPLQYATGCALFVRRVVFDKLHGFDEVFESYLEDYDFCYRAHEAGLTLGYAPGARIYHKVSLTLGERSPKKRWYLGRNTVLFYRKKRRFPKWMLWGFLIWVLIREILKGEFSYLPDFLQGVRVGLNLLKENEGLL